MTDIPILIDLGLIVVAAAALVLAARAIRTPTIIAYILAGLVLGPLTGMLEATETVELIAELGIALLLFLVGLELSLENIRDVGRVAVVAGVGQVVVTGAGGFALSVLLGFGIIESIFLCTVLTFSSTVAVVKVLTQKRELDNLYGRIAVGILLVQDLIVIVALTVLAGLGDPDDLTPGALLSGIGGSVAGMLLLLGVALLAARYVLGPVFEWMSDSPEGLFIWALTWCFLFVIGAEALHVSPEIGAFLAGVSLAQFPFNVELRRRVHPLMNFFVMVFFVALGIQMDLAAAAEYWLAALVLSVFILIGKPLIFLFIIGRMGYAARVSIKTSVTLAQISEFSFVLAAVGMASGLIDEGLLSLIGLIGLVTIGLSVYMILENDRIYRRIQGRRWLGLFGIDGGGADEEKAAEMEGHVVVVGMNALGSRIVRELIEAGEEVVAIDSDPRKLAGLPCTTVAGSTEHLSVLEEASFEEAKLLVSALQIEDANNLLAFRGREAGIATSIHAFDRLVVDELREIGADHLIQSKSAGTRKLATAVMSLDEDGE